jgi:hypothetical protein
VDGCIVVTLFMRRLCLAKFNCDCSAVESVLVNPVPKLGGQAKQRRVALVDGGPDTLARNISADSDYSLLLANAARTMGVVDLHTAGLL